MAGNIKYQTGTLTTLLDQTGSTPNTLASIAASGAAAISTTVFDNTPATNGAFWGDFELLLGFAVSPVANTTVDLYIIESVDATNYADGTGSNTPASVIAPSTAYAGSFAVRAVTAAERLVLRGVPLPPTNFKVMVVNNTGQATATSGTTQTLKILPYYEQYT